MPKLGNKRESERLELARRLHDGPAQRLIALGYQVDALIADASLGREQRSSLRRIRLELNDIARTFRDEIYLSYQVGLREAENEIKKTLLGRSVELSLDDLKVTAEQERIIALCLIEFARNSAKHSGCSRFWITARTLSSHSEIIVGDNGVWRATNRKREFGLKLIEDQLETIGGSLEFTSELEGSRFLLRLPPK